MTERSRRSHNPYELFNLHRVFGVGSANDSIDAKPSQESIEEPSIVVNIRRCKSVQRRKPGAIYETNNSSCTPRQGFSLIKMAEEQRARKVRFYRNGDRFFKGMVMAVSTQRFRTFESLLNSLTVSPLCDKKVMPCGVRHIFTADGARRIDSLDDLEHGASYVCASTDVFRCLDYSKNESPVWNREVMTNGASRRTSHTQMQQQYLQLQRQQQQQSERDDSSKSRVALSVSQSTHHHDGTRPCSAKLQSSKSEMSPTEKASYEEYMRSFVVPRLITVVRQGKKPRKSVRLLLNSKTAKNIEQVLEDIAESIRLNCGSVKKLYSFSGRRVSCLKDFFEKDSIFLACGSEKPRPDDFVLDSGEVRQVHAYRTRGRHSAAPRVTLRSSTHASSKRSESSGGCSRSSVTASTRVAASTWRDDADDSTISDVTSDDFKEDKPKIPMPLTLTTKYEIGSIIGTGNFAVVFECREKKSKKKFALKVVNTDHSKDRERMIDNEVRILRRLNHPNIIRLVEDCTFQQRVYYVMDLVKGGDLFDAICLSRKYTEQDAGSIVFNLASALDYLHTIRVVHRDVKPENILIRLFDDGTKSLKLGDFGLATEVKGPLYAICGTPSYVAPEIISENGYNTKVDIWSMGVITYILLCGFPPFVSSEDDQDELFSLIQTSSVEFPSPYWDSVNTSAKNLILSMLEKDQTRRITALQVLEHTWVMEDSVYPEDLQSVVTSGVTTNFRRSTQSFKRRGIQLIARTALDTKSKYFPVKGIQQKYGMNPMVANPLTTSTS